MRERISTGRGSSSEAGWACSASARVSRVPLEREQWEGTGDGGRGTLRKAATSASENHAGGCLTSGDVRRGEEVSKGRGMCSRGLQDDGKGEQWEKGGGRGKAREFDGSLEGGTGRAFLVGFGGLGETQPG